MNKCVIYYHTLTDEMRREDKLEWFSENKMPEISFRHIFPDKNNNWLKQTENDWETLLPLADKNVKAGKGDNAVFKLFSLGIATNRDEWVYDLNKENLEKKVKYFIEVFNNEKIRWSGSDKKEKINNFVDRSIKWTEELESHLLKNSEIKFDKKSIIRSIYRPFFKQYNYYNKIITHRIYQNNFIIPINHNDSCNRIICISGFSHNKVFQTLIIELLPGLDLLEKTQCLPLYRYDANGNRIDNITNWGLEQFRKRYEGRGTGDASIGDENNSLNINKGVEQESIIAPPSHHAPRFITKEDIFHYVYAVLHNPAYRKKYELNLKRDFPRIPFYDDFWKWTDWGKELMDLHINFETVEPAQLTIETHEPNKEPYKPKLKANKETGEIYLDNQTTISGIPRAAWNYKLGNRSALEWILDQYKEKKPKDPTIAEKFNNYRFADYKDKVTELICRVTTVSVKTMEIIDKMSK